MSEQYRGFTITYQTTMFTVEAVVKNGRGGFILSTYGTDRDDARQRVRKKIDWYLLGNENK